MARILILCHEFAPFRGGIATLVEGLANGAAGIGHDVHLLAPDYLREQIASDAGRAFTVHRFAGDFCSILSIDKLIAHSMRCRRAMRALRPDAVHAADPQSQMALTVLSRVGAAERYGFTVHGTELLRYRDEFMPRLWMRGAFRRPRTIVAVSHAVRTLLLENFDVPRERVTAAHPGIAAQWHRTPTADRLAVRRKWKLPDEAFVLLTIARRVPSKGHLRVIEAVGDLPHDVRKHLAYVVVGDGPADYAATVRQAADAAGLRLHLAGDIDDSTAIAAADAADLFVMISERTARRLEGFGIAYLEAGARGLPALAADTGGVSEAVRDGETGIVLPERPSREQVAGALLKFFDEAETRARTGEAAREFARRFTWRRHAEAVCGGLLDRIGASS